MNETYTVPVSIMKRLEEAVCNVLNFTDDMPITEKQDAWRELDLAITAWFEYQENNYV